MAPKRAKATSSARAKSRDLATRADTIKAVVFDVDGVLTDGGLWYGPDGELMKRFDVKDGHAIVLAHFVGLPVCILTARSSKIVEMRGKELRMAHVWQGKREKGSAFLELCQVLGLSPREVAYMGDDVNDLAAMEHSGLAACPSDAAPEVLRACVFVSSKPGGHGAARELLEHVMAATGQWAKALELLAHPPPRPARP